MLLEHSQFSSIVSVSDPDFAKNVAAIIVDEAHCVSQWAGSDFRPKFGQLDTLRSFVPFTVPVLATSATMTPAVVRDVKSKLAMRPEKTFELNIGNDRPNITPIVCRLKSSTDYDALNFLLDRTDPEQPFTRTIVFVKKKEHAHRVYEHLISQLPEGSPLRDQINFIHAARTQRATNYVMKRFRQGHINILIATKAAGMVSQSCSILQTLTAIVRDWISATSYVSSSSSYPAA